MVPKEFEVDLVVAILLLEAEVMERDREVHQRVGQRDGSRSKEGRWKVDINPTRKIWCLEQYGER